MIDAFVITTLSGVVLYHTSFDNGSDLELEHNINNYIQSHLITEHPTKSVNLQLNSLQSKNVLFIVIRHYQSNN